MCELSTERAERTQRLTRESAISENSGKRCKIFVNVKILENTAPPALFRAAQDEQKSPSLLPARLKQPPFSLWLSF